jgi:hypothetical protein
LLADVYSQLEFQLSSADALDLKAVTLLTGDIAAISILILVHKTVGPLWWISAALMGIAGALFLAAIRTRDWDIGADFDEFRLRWAGASPLAMTEGSFVDLAFGLEKNQPIIVARARQLRYAYRILALSLTLAVGLTLGGGPG